MRVIKPSRKAEMIERQVTCQNRACQAVIGISTSEMRYVPDFRDGASYVMTCPECAKESWIDVSKLDTY